MKRNFNTFLVLHFLSYLTQAFSYCLLITFLASIGYSATDRSWMFAISAAGGILLQFYIGYLCDKNRTIKRYTLTTNVLYCLITVVIYLYTKKNFLVHLLLVTVLCSLMRVTVGLLDGWTLEIDEECKRRYGTIRAMGSIGWSVGSYFCSLLVEKFGYGSLGAAYTLSAAIMIALYSKVKDVEKEQDQPITFADVKVLLKSKGYMLSVWILFALFVMTMCQDYTVIDKLNDLGAIEKQISMYWIVSAMVELPLFFYGNTLSEKVGMIPLLVITTIAYGIKFLLFASVHSVGWMMAASALQVCTFPLLTIVSKQLIDEESPEGMKVSGQQIALSLYSGISALIAPLMAGVLEDSIGIDFALYLIAGISLIALLLIYTYAHKGKKTGD